MRTTTWIMAGLLATALTTACSSENDRPEPAPPSRTSTSSPSGSPSATEPVRYKDASLTMGGESDDGDCGTVYASLDGTSPKLVEGGFELRYTNPDLSVAPCGGKSGQAKLSFLDPHDSVNAAYQVSGKQDGRSCNALVKSQEVPEINAGIPLSELKAGQQFCLTHPYDQNHAVELLRVEDISPDAGKVTFVVTAWGED
ncbi:hypothetical protein [Streptomyces spirodelae]|uniref:Lipoprotein n=1 Tax=Streptomyces spirodelae TaxID=2812904 RepID=A0ABS3WQ31_9ACTN|nr:hypothetical protein [Streptomyces spirodelae]MBO8185213.1 hypothetical protein [Streptomyces spirodelae]